MGETNRLSFRFLINKEVGRGTYIKAKADGREWALAQVEDIKRSNIAVERARTDFLSRQSFDRMHVTVLLRGRDGRWRRGAVEGDRLASRQAA